MMKVRSNIALSESGFIFNPNTGESFTLNPSGRILFGLLRDGRDYEDIQSYFMENFDADEPTFEKDFEDFMHLMTSYQMLESDEQE